MFKLKNTIGAGMRAIRVVLTLANGPGDEPAPPDPGGGIAPPVVALVVDVVPIGPLVPVVLV
jgi:hypothetical protein